MKKLIMIGLMLIGVTTYTYSGPKTVKSPKELIPAGYVMFEEIRGDLNKDGHEDHVFIIKGTDKSLIVKDPYRGELDRNRRGIVVALKNNNQYEMVLENLECFTSENEDGGVYYAPELGVSIERGNLFIHYAHGRYGYWSYNFRFNKGDFELIGFDSSENRGPVTLRSVSINLLTKKMLIKENISPNLDDGDEQFKETWSKFTLVKPIKFNEIDGFDVFDLNSKLGSVK